MLAPDLKHGISAILGPARAALLLGRRLMHVCGRCLAPDLGILAIMIPAHVALLLGTRAMHVHEGG